MLHVYLRILFGVGWLLNQNSFAAETSSGRAVQVLDYFQVRPTIVRVSIDGSPGPKLSIGPVPPELKSGEVVTKGQTLRCRLAGGSRGVVVAKAANFDLVAVNPEDWQKSCKSEKGWDGQPLVWIHASELAGGARIRAHATGILNIQPENREDGPLQTCKVWPGARGNVEIRGANLSLVQFNKASWPCGKNLGPNGQTRMWIPNEVLQDDTSIDLAKAADLCEVFLALERNLPNGAPEAQTEAMASTTCTVDCQRAPGVGLVADLAKIRSAHFGNKCVLEKSKTEFDSPDCSFNALLEQANDCGRDRDGRVVTCTPQQCQKNLQKAYCEHSPWRNFGIQDRFRLTVDLALGAAKRYDIDYRAIPCIAAVETTVLDPLTKNDMACTNPDRHTYHGLGMITLSTLTEYLRPGRGNGGPFRSQIPGFAKPVYYACPRLLHDALGLSAELQIELLAFTLREKNSDYAAYNGLPGHMEHYAAAVKKCVSCLQGRLGWSGKPLGKEDPVQCLSITSRTGSNGFQMRDNDQIYKDFEARQKFYCEGAK